MSKKLIFKLQQMERNLSQESQELINLLDKSLHGYDTNLSNQFKTLVNEISQLKNKIINEVATGEDSESKFTALMKKGKNLDACKLKIKLLSKDQKSDKDFLRLRQDLFTAPAVQARVLVRAKSITYWKKRLADETAELKKAAA